MTKSVVESLRPTALDAAVGGAIPCARVACWIAKRIRAVVRSANMQPHVRQHPSIGASRSPRGRRLGWLLFLASCACTHAAVPQHAGSTSDSLIAHRDRIRVSSPDCGAVVHSPLRIAGEARGNWFFEASFPVLLL